MTHNANRFEIFSKLISIYKKLITYDEMFVEKSPNGDQKKWK